MMLTFPFQRLLFLIPAGLVFFAGCATQPKGDDVISLNPYAEVDWESSHRHHGNFHTHTTRSDGRQDPAEVVDAYHAIGHEVLALTDHNVSVWPWTEFGRDPEKLGMVAVQGNELSTVPHTLSLFSGLESPTRDHEEALRKVQEIGGLSILAHPGRYWKLKDGKVPDKVLDHYLAFFRTYSSLIGVEVVNQTDRYPHDRALWDALLTALMPDRPVWGMANDDSHREHHIGLNTTVLLISDLREEEVRKALENGNMYFKSVATHSSKERDREQTPVIRRIGYDAKKKEFRIEAESGGASVPEDRIRWISAGGREVYRGSVLRLDEVEGVELYLRAEIRGEGGTAFTQPIGIKAPESR